MKGAWVMYQKEMLEAVRTYKLIWIPVVFILLGATQPVVTYYMPQILRAAGNIPPGLIENFPMPGAAEVMAQALGQYGTIGMLVLALAAMNSLAGERYGSTAELVLARPIALFGIVLAKWGGVFTLLTLSLILGAGGAFYYTILLIGSLSWTAVLTATLLYGVWLLCACSLTLLFSAFLRAPAAACVALLSAAGLMLAHSLLPSWFRWSPAALPGLSATVLATGSRTDIVWPCFSSVLLIVFCLGAATIIMNRNKLPDGI